MLGLLKIVLKIALGALVVALHPLAMLYIIIIYPVRIVDKALFVSLLAPFVYIIWSLTSAIFNLSSRLEGKNPLRRESYFVISNHLGSVDFMLINEVGRMSGMLVHIKYAVKESLKCIPFFYQVMVAAKFLILRRSFEEDKGRIKRYFDFFLSNNLPIWFILYPEGARFTEVLRAKSWEYCDRHNIPRLQHVIFPRYKGFKFICEELRNSRVKYVADVTFAYSEDKVPPLWRFILGNPTGKFKCDIKVTAIEEIQDPEKFLYESFQRKEKLIGEWKKQSDPSLTDRSLLVE
jgi:lysophosphatidic acid acyltransferase / lysophosphatidylinositol acyltransferase